MKLVEIAACGKNRELGLNGDMPWKRSLKKDLQYFRQVTNSHPMVMGRKTFESLPGMLKGRRHIVITTSDLAPKENLSIYHDLKSFLEQEVWNKKTEEFKKTDLITDQNPAESYQNQNIPNQNSLDISASKAEDEVLYVIGGASLYEQLLPYVDEVLLTEIDADFQADTWFPHLDESQFERTELEQIMDGGYVCTRALYRRKKAEDKNTADKRADGLNTGTGSDAKNHTDEYPDEKSAVSQENAPSKEKSL